MSESVLRHLTREGDRWDLIAWRYYGNPLEISRLIAANLTVFVPVIPAKPQTQADMPPWLRGDNGDDDADA
ncbi:tail protein X [Neisseria subflava]|uniref:Tail protein X n=1 Tax=Neisseria subflava TaxID=28449 RepID=A0A9X9N2E1_NEISU|nr:tail protein X [Neisseria subflava]UTG70790.1 tail protein X [Neisseria subflava]